MSKILGVILTPGDSIRGMSKSGQEVRFRKYYIASYAKHFEKVYIFSYENENVSNLPENVVVISNKFKLHRYLYGLFLPWLNINLIRRCDIFRVFHLSGTVPAIIIKIFFRKPFAFNFAYDYQAFAKIDNKSIPLLLLKIFQPLSVLFADKILAANKAILAFLPPTKTVYLPNGVDTRLFMPMKTRKESRKFRILSVGRLEKQKNYSSLIKALAGLPVQLTIVGDGSLKQDLVDLARGEKVDLEIIEKIDNNKMPKIYNQADIFVLPSLIEGHPKVLLEAMSCGLPVIGTEVEGTREIIEYNINGLLTDTTAPEIRKAIVKLTSNSRLRKQLSLRAREAIINKFNLKQLIAKELKVLLSLSKNNKERMTA